MVAGLVTTTRVTHASPAGLFARSANRNWEDDSGVRADGHDPALCPDIAHQLVHDHPGNQFKVPTLFLLSLNDVGFSVDFEYCDR